MSDDQKLRALAIMARLAVADETKRAKAELAEAKAALEATEAQGQRDEERYGDLVWLGRQERDEILYDPTHPEYRTVCELLMKYSREVDELEGERGEWLDGFHSGVLAASRLYRGLAVWKEEHADGFEPDLPTSEALDRQRAWARDAFPNLHLK